MDLFFLLVGIVLGAVGQVARIFVGLKKQYDATDIPSTGDTGTTTINGKVQDVTNKMSTFWNNKRLIISVAIGGFAGFASALVLTPLTTEINTEFILAIVAAGYAGADFIEGLMRTKAPKVTTEELNNLEEEKKKLDLEKLDKLKQLKDLKDAQVIDETEFNQMRATYIQSLMS